MPSTGNDRRKRIKLTTYKRWRRYSDTPLPYYMLFLVTLPFGLAIFGVAYSTGVQINSWSVGGFVILPTLLLGWALHRWMMDMSWADR